MATILAAQESRAIDPLTQKWTLAEGKASPCSRKVSMLRQVPTEMQYLGIISVVCFLIKSCFALIGIRKRAHNYLN